VQYGSYSEEGSTDFKLDFVLANQIVAKMQLKSFWLNNREQKLYSLTQMKVLEKRNKI
jgi:hypothetical protein